MSIVPVPTIQKSMPVEFALETSKPDSAATKRAYRKAVSMFMAEMGRKGGRIGGKRRLETMSPEERRGAALKAAKARWGHKRDVANKDTRDSG